MTTTTIAKVRERSRQHRPRRKHHPVAWRGGIHLCGTPIWCDARRPRDVSFLSAAHAADVARHGQMIATPETLALRGLSQTTGTVGTPGPTVSVEPTVSVGMHLPVGYRRPFTIGNAQLELLPSGHGLGGASLLATIDGRRILYAGAYNPHGGGLGHDADMRACDSLIVNADYGHPDFAFPTIDDAIAAVCQHVGDIITRGGTALLLVSSPSKALDVAAALRTSMANDMGPIMAHSAFCQAAARVRHITVAAELPPLQRFAPASTAASATKPSQQLAARVLLWPLSRPQTLAKLWPSLPPHSACTVISGMVCHRPLRRELSAALAPAMASKLIIDHRFAWSNRADCGELLDYIAGCRPENVYLYGRHARDLADIVDGRCRAGTSHVLAPARQMSLFD